MRTTTPPPLSTAQPIATAYQVALAKLEAAQAERDKLQQELWDERARCHWITNVALAAGVIAIAGLIGLMASIAIG